MDEENIPRLFGYAGNYSKKLTPMEAKDGGPEEGQIAYTIQEG